MASDSFWHKDYAPVNWDLVKAHKLESGLKWTEVVEVAGLPSTVNPPKQWTQGKHVQTGHIRCVEAAFGLEVGALQMGEARPYARIGRKDEARKATGDRTRKILAAAKASQDAGEIVAGDGITLEPYATAGTSKGDALAALDRAAEFVRAVVEATDEQISAANKYRELVAIMSPSKALTHSEAKRKLSELVSRSDRLSTLAGILKGA